MSYVGRASTKTLVYCMWILSRRTAKHSCGSRPALVCESTTEAMQKRKISRTHWQRIVAGNSKKVVHPCFGVLQWPTYKFHSISGLIWQTLPSEKFW